MDQNVASDNNAAEPDFFRPESGRGSQGSHSPTHVASAPQAIPPAEIEGSITWTASEFISHNKTAGWYMVFIVLAVLVGAAVWFIARDIFLVIMVTIGVILFAVYSGQRPRQQTYTLDSHGLTVGTHQYRFDEFRSYSISPEGSTPSIELAPHKRFAVYMTIYFNGKIGDRILSILSKQLPMAPPRNDLVDQLMRRIKF